MNTPLTPTSQDNKFASRLRHVWHYTQRVSSQARAVTIAGIAPVIPASVAMLPAASASASDTSPINDSTFVL